MQISGFGGGCNEQLRKVARKNENLACTMADNAELFSQFMQFMNMKNMARSPPMSIASSPRGDTAASCSVTVASQDGDRGYTIDASYQAALSEWTKSQKKFVTKTIHTFFKKRSWDWDKKWSKQKTGRVNKVIEEVMRACGLPRKHVSFVEKRLAVKFSDKRHRVNKAAGQKRSADDSSSDSSSESESDNKRPKRRRPAEPTEPTAAPNHARTANPRRLIDDLDVASGSSGTPVVGMTVELRDKDYANYGTGIYCFLFLPLIDLSFV